MRASTLCAALLILAFAGIMPANSQTPRIVDLQLTGTLSPAGQLRPGTTARLTLTFRNNGPEDSLGAAAVSTPYVFGVGELFDLASSLPSPCGLQFTDFNAPPGSGRPSFLVAIVQAGALPAGASRTCTFDVLVAPDASGTTGLSFDVRDGAVTIADPVSSNNVVSFGLVFDPPIEVPALSGPLLMFLALAMALGSLIHRQRHQ